jgi:hypothetical protein
MGTYMEEVEWGCVSGVSLDLVEGRDSLGDLWRRLDSVSKCVDIEKATVLQSVLERWKVKEGLGARDQSGRSPPRSLVPRSRNLITRRHTLIGVYMHTNIRTGDLA